MFRTRRLMLVQVRKEEAGLVVRVSALFALCGIAMTLAANTKDGLFLDRVGAEHLPPMYVALGIVSFLFLMAYTSGLKRFADRRVVFAVSVPVALAVVVLGERALLLLKMDAAVVPVVWLTVEVITAFMLLISWNISGEVNDTLQAKRLFPVYVSAAVAGRFTGNAITSPLNLLLGTENLLIVYAVVVLLAAWLIYIITQRYAPPRPRQVIAVGLLDDLREGFAAIRQTPLLKLVAYATVVNATLAFMVSFLFNTAVQDAIPTDRAGFLGQFYTVTTVVIFVISFFLASRLYARLGLINSFLILPASYLVVFILLAINRTILPAAVGQFVKFIALYAVADGALNAIFNVIPATSRGQVRTFNSAVAQQVGIVLSGFFIILTQLLLSPDQVVILGLALAVTGSVLVWRMHGEYGDALVQALKAGRFEVFTADEGSLFANFEGHAGAIELAINTLHDDQPASRVLGANLLALMHARSAVPALIAAAEDPDAEVRSEVINALAELNAQEAVNVIQSRLGDEDYRVRVAALRALPQVAPEASDILISGDQALPAR